MSRSHAAHAAILTSLVLSVAACGGNSEEELLTAPAAVSAPAPTNVIGAPLVFAVTPSDAATTPVATPTPTPRPAATPTPAPATSASSGCSDCPEEPITNTSQPARVSVRVYYIANEDGNITTLDQLDYIPVGYKIYLDVGAKDRDGVPTNGSSDVRWFLADSSLTTINDGAPNAFQRKLRVLRAGTQEVYVTLDGVKSEVLRLRLKQ